MKRKTICTLQVERAIEAIKDVRTVMYRHGVWNEYHERETAGVIESIRKSGYGADVFQDENGTFYVSIPCDADMW